MREECGDAGLVYLLHGLLGTAYGHFGAQISLLRHSYRLVPVDLPGHGRCKRDAVEAYLDDAFAYLSAVMQHFGAGHVVATSYLGGPLGVRCAQEHPALVRSLTLTGFAPELPQAVFDEWCTAFQRLASEDADLSDEFLKLHGPRWRQTLSAFIGDAQLSYEHRVLVSADDLRTLEQPTLIVNGSWKELERQAARTAPTLGPHVSGRVIAGAGHVPAQDKPEAFNEAVTSFWQGLAERSAAS